MAGLLHDVGKLVIAMLSPEAFSYLLMKAREENLSFHKAEHTYFDTDHGSLGGWYLERQNLPPTVSEAVRCHHNWTNAVKNPEIAAIVNVADFLARTSGVGNSGNMEPISESYWDIPSWGFLISNHVLKEPMPVVQERISEESVRLGLLVDSLLPPTTPKPIPIAAVSTSEEGNGEK
jgi:hypothetical protein